MRIREQILDLINWDDMLSYAKAIVEELEDEDSPGSAKMETAIKRLATYLDDQLDWADIFPHKPVAASILEWADGRVLYFLLRGVLESALIAVRDEACDYC